MLLPTVSLGALLPLLLILLLDKAPAARGIYVPGRCQCPHAMKRTPGRPLDFKVIESSSYCHTTEIMVKVKGHASLLCLSASGRQGKRLLKCWRRVTRQGKDRKQCLRTPKNPRNPRNPRNPQNPQNTRNRRRQRQ